MGYTSLETQKEKISQLLSTKRIRFRSTKSGILKTPTPKVTCIAGQAAEGTSLLIPDSTRGQYRETNAND
jgi:hypothetical protein